MKEKLLSMLKASPSCFLSGEELSEQLGVSRTAIWKHVRSLREEGYAIDSSPRLGYRLVAVPDLLLPAEIQEGLRTRFLGRTIHYREETDSTNRLARELALAGEPEGSIVLAETQRRGRGRLGREWSSPRGGIWMSLILRPDLAPYDAQLLTLTAAVAAVAATLAVTGRAAGIKWPNDIMLAGKKVAGILTELAAETDRVNFLVIGIGVNANFSAGCLPADLQDKATTLLGETGAAVNRAEWVREFLLHLEDLYTGARSDRFSDVLKKWRVYSETLGRQVTVSLADRAVTGLALDIDTHGALLLKTEAGTETMLAGEVTLQPSGREK